MDAPLIINAKNTGPYSLVGDGITDEATDMENLLRYAKWLGLCSGRRVVVFFPAGIYPINELPGGVGLMGERPSWVEIEQAEGG